MENTIGYVISRIRRSIKSVNADAFLTDRYLYSLVSKHGAWLLKREDSLNRLMRFISIFQSLNIVDLIEVDKIEAQCVGIKSNCIIMRTAERLPNIHQGYWGPLIRTVSSLDGSEEVQPTTSTQFTKIANSKNFKYNKSKYYWILDGYMYFPNLDWDNVKIEGVFDDDISDYNCTECDKDCLTRQQQPSNIPDYLYGELENFVLKELGFSFQLPSDPIPDKLNPIR